MNKKRVAITGLGAVSPLGNDVDSTWSALLAGASGIAPIEHFDATSFPTTIAAEVKNFQPDARHRGKHLRFAMPFTHYALSAAQQAFDDAGIKPNEQSAPHWGVVVGSGMMTAEFDYLHRFQQHCAPEGEVDWDLLQKNKKEFYKLNDFGKTTSNSGLSLLIQQFGIRGYATSVHTACASGGQALGLAMQVIRRGEADYMLAGGFDSMINPLGLSSFCLLGALSTYNDTPHTASRPFDGTRNGFVLGEGAAFLILEDWEKAKARGAHIYAELAGEGNSLSSYRITDSHPNGDGALQAIERALKDADVHADEVDYINAHGTSTKMNDLSETNAIKVAFAARASSLPASSTKSQTGHLIAAAGALEAVLSVKAIEQAVMPQTANLNTADPECDLDYVVDGPRKKSLKVVLSNSFGFGGSNSCLLFKHPQYEGGIIMTEQNRVFITGRSALTAAGASADETWGSVLAGRSGIAPIEDWAINDWACHLGGELKNFQAAKMLPDRKLIKVISRQDVMGIHAAVKAVEHSGMIEYRDQLTDATAFNEQTAVYVGSPGNKYFQQYDFLPLLAKTKGAMQPFAEQLFAEVHPMWLLRILPNNVLAYAGITYGFKGPNHNITNHAVGGSQAILEAYHAIKTGQADRAVVVAYDTGIEPQAMFYYEQLGVLSERHLKPFDVQHDGTLLADGAAALVLESEASVRARNAQCYGELLGGATASEGQGLFSIDGEGKALAALLAKALDSAALSADDLGLIVAHGNGNSKSDNSEALAITAVFANRQPALTGFKWALGHTLCASGTVDAVMTTYALEDSSAPGIANLERKTQAASGLSLSADHQALASPYALVINRGFASMNTCLVLKACE